jgi:hypothetical protein
MSFLNLFSRKKEKPVSVKELYAPVLEDMWVCAFNFCPWNQEEHRVVYKKVGIVTARAYKDGIYVESNFKNPFYGSAGEMTGYVNKLSIRHNCGFFETEDAAKTAYKELMNKWIDVIKSTMETP